MGPRQKLINEIRRGLECALIHFCSIGDIKMSPTNRKVTKPEDCQSKNTYLQSWTIMCPTMKAQRTSNLSQIFLMMQKRRLKNRMKRKIKMMLRMMLR